MSWTGHPSTASENGGFATALAAASVTDDLRNQRAARVTAGRSLDAADCAEMLAMLGLDAGADRTAVD
jgi:hypothetical protein